MVDRRLTVNSLYQTFDALDGKQCHRTQESEIEEFADHAADAVSTTLNVILLAAALQLGKSPLLAVTHVLALTAFHGAHWAALVTNSLALGAIGVSESQWAMIVIHLITAMRPELWDEVVPEAITTGASRTLGKVVGFALVAALVVQNYRNVQVIIGSQETPLEAHGIAIPRRPLLFQPLLPCSATLAELILCFQSALFDSMALPVILVVGLSFARASMQLMLEKFARRKRIGYLCHMSTFCPLILFVLARYLEDTEAHGRMVAWTMVIMLVADVLWYVTAVMSDLKQARNINVFSMKQGLGGPYPRSTGFYVADGNLESVREAWREFAAEQERVKATYGLVQ